MKFLAFMSARINIQKEVGDLLVSRETKEQTRIRLPFVEKKGKGPNYVLYDTFATL